MKITHKKKSTVTSIVNDMDDYSLETNCNSILLVNSGVDVAKVFMNNDDANFYTLEVDATLEIFVDEPDTLLMDIIKITFNTSIGSLINVLKQTKTLIV